MQTKVASLTRTLIYLFIDWLIIYIFIKKATWGYIQSVLGKSMELVVTVINWEDFMCCNLVSQWWTIWLNKEYILKKKKNLGVSKLLCEISFTWVLESSVCFIDLFFSGIYVAFEKSQVFQPRRQRSSKLAEKLHFFWRSLVSMGSRATIRCSSEWGVWGENTLRLFLELKPSGRLEKQRRKREPQIRALTVKLFCHCFFFPIKHLWSLNIAAE